MAAPSRRLVLFQPGNARFPGRGFPQALANCADLYQRTIAQPVDFHRGVVRESGRQLQIAEISRHPVEQCRGVCIGQRRLSHSGNPDDVISPFGRCRKQHQRAAYGRDPASLPRPIGEMTAHAVQLVIDGGLVTPRGVCGRPRERNCRRCSRDSHADLLGRTHDARGGAMIRNIGLGVAGAPIVIVGLARLK